MIKELMEIYEYSRLNDGEPECIFAETLIKTQHIWRFLKRRCIVIYHKEQRISRTTVKCLEPLRAS